MKKRFCPVDTLKSMQTIFNEKKDDYVFGLLPNDLKANEVLQSFLDSVDMKEYKKSSVQRDLFPIFSLFIKRNQLYLCYE